MHIPFQQACGQAFWLLLQGHMGMAGGWHANCNYSYCPNDRAESSSILLNAKGSVHDAWRGFTSDHQEARPSIWRDIITRARQAPLAGASCLHCLLGMLGSCTRACVRLAVCHFLRVQAACCSAADISCLPCQAPEIITGLGASFSADIW